jgi:hypothetical protein
VEGDVAVEPLADGRASPRQGLEQRALEGVEVRRPGAAGGEAEHGGLEEAAELVELGALLLGADAGDQGVELRLGPEGQDAEAHAGLGLHHAQGPQRLDRLADERPADPEAPREGVLGGKPPAGLDAVALDHPLDLVGDAGGADHAHELSDN